MGTTKSALLNGPYYITLRDVFHLLCWVLTWKFDMGGGAHKEQHIRFPAPAARKASGRLHHLIIILLFCLLLLL